MNALQSPTAPVASATGPVAASRPPSPVQGIGIIAPHRRDRRHPVKMRRIVPVICQAINNLAAIAAGAWVSIGIFSGREGRGALQFRIYACNIEDL
ncbi:MAG TPA: hypothetical protein VND80_06480 [Steroidobacteraceae bacterium]|nr:hypothetical protein [Steroidobacteraceae bacterium]